MRSMKGGALKGFLFSRIYAYGLLISSPELAPFLSLKEVFDDARMAL